MKFKTELLAIADELSNEDAGKLFKAIASYHIRGETPSDSVMKALFAPFKFSIDEQKKREEEIREKRRESGSIGGLAKADKCKQKLASATKCQKNTIEKRKENFYNSLVPFVNTYKKEMIRTFYDYWSEYNKSGTKMRFELERTWEVSKRLVTWANREKVNGKSTDKTASRKELDDLADAVLASYQP